MAGRPAIRLILARDRSGVIGRDGGLPWHLPEDLAHFRRTTMHQPVLMGRRTWASLPERFRPLPGRRNLVLSRQAGWLAPGAEVCDSLAQAVARCADEAVLWVIGGVQLWQAAWPLAERVVVTEIEADFPGDLRLPDALRLPGRFHETARERHQAQPPNDFAFSWVTYEQSL